MEAEQVIQKILADANAEAEKIKKQAEQNEASEQQKQQRRLEDYKKQTEALAQKAGEDEKSHILAAARMDAAKRYLAAKRKILDEVFNQAGRDLQNLPDEQYRALCKKLMLDAIETGDEEVVVDRNENRINQNFINQVNQELGSDYRANLRLSDERQDLGAGFILKHGKVNTNVSVDVLLDQARKALEIELAKELFGN